MKAASVRFDCGDGIGTAVRQITEIWMIDGDAPLVPR